MTMRSAGYWTTTTIIAIAFLSGGAAYLAGAGFALQGMLALGYPAYFVTILGAWKALGAIAILGPRSPRLKEWAYAGIAFDLSGAALSHVAVGDPAAKVLAPLVMLGIAAASWALRPPGRRLQGIAGRPTEASHAGAPDAMARAAA